MNAKPKIAREDTQIQLDNIPPGQSDQDAVDVDTGFIHTGLFTFSHLAQYDQ